MQGTHTVTVTDQRGCSSTCDVEITEPAAALSCLATEIDPVVCFGESNGQATVTPAGGNGIYTYLWDNGETTQTAFSLNAGVHTVTVTDRRGCTTTCDVTITQPAAEISCTAVEIDPVVCFGESNGQATVTPAGGNGIYTYAWDNGETTATAIALDAGTHTVTVTDQRGCSTTCDVEITQPAAAITCTAVEIDPVVCFGESNGQATVTPAGGNGTYTYLWDNGETTATAIALDAGTHTVTVTDQRGCETTCDVEITQPAAAITCTAVEIDPVVCFGESNGQATVTPAGGNGTYTYLWDNGETTATAIALDAGTHTVTVTDQRACSTTCDVEITEPAAEITCSAVEIDPVVCFGESNGQATVTPAGGNGTYTYLWDNGETTVTATALDAGTHTVTVTDQRGCSTSCDVEITEPAAEITCSAVEIDPVVCYGESNGQATVTPAGGNGTYTYLWDNGETTATATALDAGTHTVTVTDQRGCSTTCDVEITEPVAEITCTAVEIDPVVCFGESNGQATVTPAGGNGIYTYLWDNGETTATAIALDAGTHTVTVTDQRGCSSTCDVEITEPAAALSCLATEIDPVVCFGESNGQATVTPAGGNGTYSYLWDNGETTATAIALDAGTHTVTVTDQRGCSTTCNVEITEPAAAITCTAVEIDPVVCFGESNGQATVTPAGGNGTYTYLWDNGETTATATALDAGTHTVTVIDQRGCSTTCDVTITQPAAAITCTAVEIDPVVCFGESNGQATVTPAGGNGTYTYLWDNGETTATAIALDAGTHTVTVTDQRGCSTTCNVEITEPAAAITCTAVEIDPVVCFGESNGQATVTPAGGNGTYTYLWDNGETTATAIELDAGTHTVTVTDQRGCSTTCNVEITEPAAAITCTAVEIDPVVCFGESNGQATVAPAGGNGIYAYLWDNGETTATAIALDAGTHTVTVTDQRGCSTTCDVEITEPAAAITCTAIEIDPVVCFGESNGQATVTPAGGNGTYTYLWDNGETTATATALDAGTHTVTVTDQRGCSTTCDVEITEPAAAITCTAVEIDPVVCFGESNGQATVTPAGGNGTYTYLWDNGETTATATALDAGTHTVTVTDQRGCSTTCDVTITQPAAAITCTAVEIDPVVCFGESNGQATVTPAGGNGTYTYLWDNGETTATAIALDAGTHTVTVTDQRGCSTTCDVEITEPAAAITCTAVEIDPVVCFGESNGQATVTPAGGNGIYTYLWDNGETTATAIALDAGTHTVTVTDQRGCETTCDVEITEPAAEITCTAVEIDPVVCFGESNGQATVTPAGGNGIYTYLWDNGETTATAIALDAGTHTVTVTDQRGCSTTCDVEITEPAAEITCTAVEIDPVVCFGESNGQATVTQAGGNGTYSYLWDNGETTATATALDAGTHTVTVTDQRGCSTTCDVTITQPAAEITCTAIEIDPVVCFGESNGQATVTPAGGNGTYTYLWDNGETTATAIALDAGTHTVTVTDQRGCETTCDVTITQPAAEITCTVVEIDPVVCFGESNGQATVTPAGGNGTYTYLWDNGENGQTANGLNAGVHTVTVTDQRGCTTTCDVTITQPAAEITCSAIEIDPVVCFGESNGQATVTPAGGNGGYIYNWDNGETTQTALALDAGIHRVTVTDQRGCSTTCQVTITQPAAEITCSAVEIDPVVCFGESNGQATVTPAGGNGTYTYLWDNGETTATAIALDAGTHTVTVTDQRGCETSCTVNISQPAGEVTCIVSQDSPVVCFGESNGQATVTPAGGNGNYSYSWDNGETTQTATALNAGTHTVTVTRSKRLFYNL